MAGNATIGPLIGDGQLGSQIALISPLAVGALCTALFYVAKSCIFRRLERRATMPKEQWHLKGHLLFSNFLLAASFFVHAFYAVMPFNFTFALVGDTHKAVVFLLSRDTVAVFNCLHGIFVFGAATRYLWTKKPLWWFLIHVYMLCTSLVAFLLSLIQCFEFGAIVLANAMITGAQTAVNVYCICSVVAASPEKLFVRSLAAAEEGEATDPETEAWKLSLLRILYLEVLTFFMYNVAVVFVRIPVARTEIVMLDRFVYQFIQAYVMSIHKGIVLGFGFQGVINHSISALRFYQFAQYLLGGIAAAALLPMAYTMYTAYEPLYWLSVVIIVVQAGLQVTGALYAGFVIDMTGGSLHEDSKAADQQALVSTTTVDSLRVRAWLIAVLVVWQIESITLVVMQLWAGQDIKEVASGVNYSFHGLFILLISFMKGNVATGLPSRRRRYQILLYFILLCISAFELGSAAVVWFGHKERGFAVVVFIVIAGTRLWTSVGTAVAFIIEDRRASREMRRAAEKEAEQAPAVSPVAAIELVVERKDETITEGSPYYRAMQRRAELAIKIAGYGGLCFVLSLLAVLREDYAALVGPQYTSADVGAHSPAYVMAFHLCLLLVGWGTLGVRWNRIGYLVSSCFGFSGLAVVGLASFLVALQQWDSSSFDSNVILFSTAALCLPSLGASIVMIQFIALLMRANVNPLHFIW